MFLNLALRLKVIAITLAVIMFISGLDDFFIDVVYWVRRIKRKLSVIAATRE